MTSRFTDEFVRHITFDDLRTATLAAFIFLLPMFSKLLVFINQFTSNLDHPLLNSTFVSPTDALLVIATVLAVPLVRRKDRNSFGIATRGAVGMTIIVAIAVALNPTIEGTVMLVRVVGIAAVVLIATSLKQRDFARAIVWPLAISAMLQSTLALLQTLVWNNGMTVDATTLAAARQWTAGHGTFTEPYNLPAFLGLTIAVLLVEYVRGRGRSFHTMTIVIASAAIATTFGRTAALSIVAVGVTYLVASLVSRRRDYLYAAVAAVVPLIAMGVVLRAGWLARATESSSLTSDIRWMLAKRAITIIADNPIAGLGPVQYGSRVPPGDGFIVHNVPLLTAAEFGVAVGIALVLWLTLLGYRTFVKSIPAGAVFASAIPFLLFDNLHYVLGVGLGMVAIWLAAIAREADLEPTHENSSDPPIAYPEAATEIDRMNT